MRANGHGLVGRGKGQNLRSSTAPAEEEDCIPASIATVACARRRLMNLLWGQMRATALKPVLVKAACINHFSYIGHTNTTEGRTSERTKPEESFLFFFFYFFFDMIYRIKPTVFVRLPPKAQSLARVHACLETFSQSPKSS